MIKKTFTLARGPKAFVMATFIAISGMYSVQAMQQISPELVTAAQDVRVKTRTVNTEQDLAPILNKLHAQIKTDKKALSKNELARKELKDTLIAIQSNINAKSGLATESFSIYIGKTMEEINKTVAELENNTINDGFIARMWNKLDEIGNEAKKNRELCLKLDRERLENEEKVVANANNDNAPEVSSAKHDEGTIAPNDLTQDQEDALAGWAPVKKNVQTVKTDVSTDNFLTEDQEDALAGWAQKKVVETPKVEPSVKVITKDEIITMTKEEFLKRLSIERQNGTFKGLTIGNVCMIILSIGFIILESGALDSLLGIPTGK